jgi:RNA polymerase sigma factor for flagellar operon FliA
VAATRDATRRADRRAVAAQPDAAPSGRVPAPRSSLSARDIAALVESHLPLIPAITRNITAHYPRHADREELEQAAALGLTEAAHRYDPERGVPFARWASMRIHGAIVDASRQLDFAPRSVRAADRETERARTALAQSLGRTPTGAELATSLGITEAELATREARVHAGLVLSMDSLVSSEDGSPVDLSASMVDPVNPDPADAVQEKEMRAYVQHALVMLPERLRVVIEGYFIIGRTSAALAEELNVTESRIAQMRAEGLAMMRHGLGEHLDAPPAPVDARLGRRAAAARAQYASALAAHTSLRTRLSGRPESPAARNADEAAAV